MSILYYYITFALSLLLLFVYVWRRNKQFNAVFTIINTIIPVVNLGYLLVAISVSLEEALIADKIVYFGVCFLLPLFLLSIMYTCKMEIRRWTILLMFVLNVSIYALVLEAGRGGIYYKNVEFLKENGVGFIHKSYGTGYLFFYAVLVIYAVVSLFLIGYGFFVRKRSTSVKVLILQMSCVIVFGGVFIFEKEHTQLYELLPAAFVIGQFIYIIIVNTIYMYDMDYMSVESHAKNVDMGFFSVDKKIKFLGCNHIAKLYFEDLRDLYIDRRIPKDTDFLCNIYEWVGEIDTRQGTVTKIVPRNARVYKITAGYLVDNMKIKGYQFIIEDDTKEQKYIDIINNYNDKLENDVYKKTRTLRDMQDKLILGMADMVENRDNNTGGHIKRTSHVVRILMDEIMKDNTMNFDKTFYEYVIKAAPMHDLGKIAVDDIILRKPGKFTMEEYEIMKSHAEKGAEIVKKILDGIEDPNFVRIATNVAHYHHERFDGSGYPSYLKGNAIPVEARIMAIADVYDALVSKRCYKDEMSFDDAFRIIEDGMGKDFDPSFNIYFIRCRKRLEEYYLNDKM